MSIEVDGEPGGPQLERSRARPAWGMPAAVVVVGALVLGVGWTVLQSGASSTASPPAVSTPTTEVEEPAATDAPLVAGGSSTTMPPPAAAGLHDPVEATRAALAAWGEFAVTGDLSGVRRTFVAGGPQLGQLEQEAARIQPTDAAGYRVSLTDASVEEAGGVATVTGTVVWARAGEADQLYRWAIELQEVEGGWRLFTVRTVGG